MEELNVEKIITDLKDNLNKSLSFLKSEFAVIRAGRANPRMLDKVFVDYYGTPTPVSQMANLAVPEARLLTVSVWDLSQVKAVSKAISIADLGANVSDDGRVIRLNFPALTEERRKEILKQTKSILENSKVTMRNSRRDAIDAFKALKKDSLISEDDVKYYEDEVQKILDEFISLADKSFEDKEKEIMQV